ncbi:MerR family transcriptional regulator [Nesterenkonia xinjiangensis]|uniref:DNA-binding transcriptional MerR regulator n=1 Tax=Nesterenkonia xinjiangensis TaxID=225327 RepID=A0A7Z0GLW3_9MICC|nr:DNA-binding transcriptional MerR regulator [Nesterenkonia xinjiangensis]
MPWSTRQLAELAGVTVKAVRHYHRLGLLDEPTRSLNGYKHYDGADLVSLLQIRKMIERGFSLSQIADMDDDSRHQDSIRDMDSHLGAEIERLTGLREELSALLEHGSTPETPAGFVTVSQGLSENQRKLLVVYERFFSAEVVNSLERMLLDRTEEERQIDDDFDQLPENSDGAEIDHLAQRMVPMIQRLRRDHAWPDDPLEDSPHGAGTAGYALAHTLVKVYHTAQIRVLQQVDAILQDQPWSSSPAD